MGEVEGKETGREGWGHRGLHRHFSILFIAKQKDSSKRGLRTSHGSLSLARLEGLLGPIMSPVHHLALVSAKTHRGGRDVTSVGEHRLGRSWTL